MNKASHPNQQGETVWLDIGDPHRSASGGSELTHGVNDGHHGSKYKPQITEYYEGEGSNGELSPFEQQLLMQKWRDENG